MLAALAVACFAILALLGWTIDNNSLKQLGPGAVAMNPLTAVVFMLAAICLALCAQERITSRTLLVGLSLAIILVGAQRLLVYGLHIDLALDRLLFRGKLGENRIAPNTAAAFVLLGAAIMCLDFSTPGGLRPSVWLTMGTLCISILAISGYLYRVNELYTIADFIPMAPNTAICFGLTGLGLLFARPEREPMATMISDTAGGVAARRLLPAAIVLPVVIGYLKQKGEAIGFFNAPTGTSLFAGSTMVVFVALIWLSARSLFRADVRERAVEAALRSSEAFYHSLVETLPQNIFRKDLEGRFTFANQRFCGEIGRPLERVIGTSDFDYFPRELAERYRADDREVVESGKAFETVEEHVTPSGDKLYVQVIKSPVYDADGHEIGLQGIFWDVTEKKRAEQELEMKNKMLEEVARSEREAHEVLKKAQSTMIQSEKLVGLGQMVAGVAHEINNPLAFVGNNVAVLQRDLKAVWEIMALYQQAQEAIAKAMPDLAAKIKETSQRADLAYTLENTDELLNRSREGLKRIQQIVRDLRDFARLDASDVQEADLNAGIESTVNIIRGRAKRKQVELELDLRPLPPVTCNSAKINQVIMNLLANAIDACDDHGHVAIHTSESNGSIRIEVTDNGKGIPSAIRDKIFDPFFTTKPPGEGTGLGLSISYGIVKDHGGAIEVQSEMGKGSTFVVTLPRDCPAAAR